VRENNQDQFLVAQIRRAAALKATTLDADQPIMGDPQAELLIVADGMGGHAAGEKASQLAIGSLTRQLLGGSDLFANVDGEQAESELAKQLGALLTNVHRIICSEAERRESDRGMGTTLTMAYVRWPQLYVVHAGDSRCYLIRNGVAKQVTTDHTIARQMVESGELSAEEEATSKFSHVLWNVLGGNPDSRLDAEIRRVNLRSGDAIVLCSDGLHRYVDSEELSRIVGDSESPEAACRRLIAVANERGGEDNITVVVSRFQSEDDAMTTWVGEHDTTP